MEPTFGQSPFIFSFHVSPADALMIGAQPVDFLLCPVVIQSEDWPNSRGEKLQLTALDSKD